MLVFFLLIPLTCPLMCTFVCAGRIMHRIPMTMVSGDGATLDHRFVHAISTDTSIRVRSRYTSVRRKGGLLGRAEMCNVLCVPRDFDGSVSSKGRAAIDVCYSVDNVLCCGTLMLTDAGTSLALGGGVRVRQVKGAARQRSRVDATPVRCRSVSLFGPRSKFTDFLVPTILVLVVRRALLLNVKLSTKATHRGGHFGSLIPVDQRCRNALHVMNKGSLTCFLVCTLITTCILYLMPRLFSLMRVTRPVALLTFIIPCVLTYVFFTVAYSVFVRRERSYLVVCIFASIPLLFVSKVS